MSGEMGVFSPERAYRGNLPPPAPRRTRSPCQEVVRRETGSPDLVFQYREAHQSQTIGAVQFILDKNQQDALHITITTLGYFQVNYPEDTRSGKRAGASPTSTKNGTTVSMERNCMHSGTMFGSTISMMMWRKRRSYLLQRACSESKVGCTLIDCFYS